MLTEKALCESAVHSTSVHEFHWDWDHAAFETGDMQFFNSIQTFSNMRVRDQNLMPSIRLMQIKNPNFKRIHFQIVGNIFLKE